MAVLVLQAFAVQRRAPGSGAEQKALGAAVGGEPDFVAHALRAEHRVVNIERDDIHAVIGVGRASGDKRRHRTGLGDAFLENLAVLRFVIEAHALVVHRLVELALGRVDADLAEERIDAKRARFVGDDRHDFAPDGFVANQRAQQPHKTLRGGRLGGAGAFGEIGKTFEARRLERLRGHDALGHKAAEFLAALQMYLVSGESLAGR